MRLEALTLARLLAEGDAVPISDKVMPVLQELSVLRFPMLRDGNVVRVPHHLRPLAERVIYSTLEPEEQHYPGAV